MAECLFCRSDGPFRTVEHIIPESLGNDTDVLKGRVCDACQNYLGREVEKPALEKTPIAFWRTFLGIQTKGKKLPTVDLTPPRKGRIPASHTLTDSIRFSAHLDGSTSVAIDQPERIRSILEGRCTDFKLVLSPFHLITLGRLFGKIGLEFSGISQLELSDVGKI